MEETMKKDNSLLGPFIGHTTTHSAKIWMYAENYQKLFVKIYSNTHDNLDEKIFNFLGEIPADCVEFTNLNPNTQYYYKIFTEDNAQLKILDLEDSDCCFWTMPETESEGDVPYQYNFLVLSCHDPFKNK